MEGTRENDNKCDRLEVEGGINKMRRSVYLLNVGKHDTVCDNSAATSAKLMDFSPLD